MNDTEMQTLIRDFRLEIEQSPTIIRGPLANDYLQHLGAKLSSYAPDKNVHYAFFINQSNEINAFAGPGGTIVIYSALILATRNEDELVAVLAHEIAHSEQKHWLKNINRAKKMQVPMVASTLAALALGAVSPALSSGALMGSLAGYQQSNINYTRTHEEDADRIGIQILYAAGYNPNGMIEFFKQMQHDNQYHNYSHVPEILLTHPLDEVRIADAQSHIDKLPASALRVPATRDPAYFLFKEIIRVLSTSKPATLLPYYEKNLKLHPQDTALHYGYALTLMKMLRWNQAKKELAILLKKSPENYYYLLALSGCELGLKNAPQALKILHELYDRYPDNPAIILDEASALIHVHQCALAVKYLNEALEDNQNNIVLLEKLSQAQACNHETARAYLTRSKWLLLLGDTRGAGIALHSAQQSVSNDPLLMLQINAAFKALNERKRREEA